jgi:CRISPR-associated protein Csm4
MNYKDYQININFKTKFITTMQSDTLMGYILYVLAEQDKELFEKWYKQFINNQPPFICSSIMPESMIPFIGKNLLQLKHNQDNKDYQNNTSQSNLKKIKKIKKIAYLNIEECLKTHKTKSLNDIFNLVSDKEKDFITEKPILKNQILIDEDHDNNLFTINEKKINKKARIIIRVFERNQGNIEIIEKILAHIGEIGFGKKKSIGYGAFEIIKQEKINLPKEGDYMINLSQFVPVIPKNTDKKNQKEKPSLEPKSYNIHIKNPKTGEQASRNIFKPSIVMIAEGGLFKINKIEDFYGQKLETGLKHTQDNKDIIQCLYTIPYFIQLEQQNNNSLKNKNDKKRSRK